ncbi:MAG TPA: hypothetical protein VG795_04155 [Acidimicrobiia bacterium]|nr:hypothetical protein [Acidimicrobiia bacterium]
MSRVIPFPLSMPPSRDGCRPVFSPVSLRDAVAFSRRRHRGFIAAAAEWALAQGVSLPADHIAVWAATGDDLGWPCNVDGFSGPWRASDLPDLMASIATWCALVDCSAPGNLTESLWHLYGFLASTGRLHPASDSLPELRAALVVFSPFDRFGPASPPPEPPAA